MPKHFVKSADTSTSAANSRSELERVLRRYGATGFSVAQDYARREVVVSFIVPDTPDANAPKVPVRLPVSIYSVYDALFGQPRRTVYAKDADERALPPFNGKSFAHVRDANGYNAKKLDQAERVAWRNLILWVDAALSAAVCRLQTITEAFFAHTVVGAGGERMIELVDTYQRELGPGVQRLLTSTTEGTT